MRHLGSTEEVLELYRGGIGAASTREQVGIDAEPRARSRWHCGDLRQHYGGTVAALRQYRDGTGHRGGTEAAPRQYR